ncbi:MAG: polysaccharide deacetylase family protein [Clostridia bacterium]|nr:polysaccharide deacetylase family protein [Clostridia bacterium]
MVEFYMRFPGFKTRAVTLSYDDGKAFDREMVQILNKYGVKCTFNLNSNLLDRSNYVTKAEINSLYKGHEVAVHTFTHPHLQSITSGGVALQIIIDRELLESITGNIVKGMAYPFGLAHESIPDIAKTCGINYARVVSPSYDFSLPKDFLKWNPTCHHGDEKIYDLIEKFFEEDDLERPWRNTPKVFYIWGHSYEFENNFDRLEDLCKKLAGNDSVWYATNGEIFDYVNQYKRLDFSLKGGIVHNPTATDIYTLANCKNLLIPAGKTIIIEE